MAVAASTHSAILAMDATYSRRVFKVSRELDPLALAAEQHRRQTAHRRGLPDWTVPAVPAGVPSAEHERVPTFFAWERTGEAAPLTPVGTPRVEAVRETAAVGGDAGESALAAEEHSTDDVVMTPTRQLAIDLTSPELEAQPTEPATPAETAAEAPLEVEDATTRSQADVSSTPMPMTPTRVHASPRYQHGRGLSEMDVARPSSANSNRSTPAGISTVAYDRFKKRPSFRSPDWARRRPNKRLAFLESQVQLAQEEHERADQAERNQGTGRRWSEASSQNLYGRRTYVLSGSDALQVANSAVREFLHDFPQETATADRGVTQPTVVSNAANSVSAPTTPSQRQTQLPARVPTVDEAVQVNLVQPERRPKRTVLLVDSATQTSPPTRPPTTPVRGGQATPRSNTPSSSIHRIRRPAPTTPQAFNPILMNQRYPPEPSIFRAQTSYNLEFSGQRRASR